MSFCDDFRFAMVSGKRAKWPLPGYLSSSKLKLSGSGFTDREGRGVSQLGPAGPCIPLKELSGRSKPDSVILRKRTHSFIYRKSSTPISKSGVRHTRNHRAGHPVPYSVLHRIGFVMPPPLPSGRWALTPPFHLCQTFRKNATWPFVFCDTFRRLNIDVQTPPLARGILPCGVRTFLSPILPRERMPSS